MPVKAPFPWFGGKSKAADLIWSRIGDDIGNYVEPFFGSGAVFHGRPSSFSGWSTVNDKDGLVSNFWRSVEKFPQETAQYASAPVNECDLHAKHLYLVRNAVLLAQKLSADPDYCDPKIAGWWAWGATVWIGSGWCNGSGPWTEVDGLFVNAKDNLGDGGTGVNRQLPHLGDGGTGVNRQLPHLGNGGKGVTAQRTEWVTKWFIELQDSLRDVRICCGDWLRIMSIGTMTRNGVAGVVLDPPYSQTKAVYAHDCNTISSEVREWCKKYGNNPLLRIALGGHDGEHNELESMGWSVETWDKSGGYQGEDDRERIWFSPNCIPEQKEFEQLSLF